ncbi:MAG: TolC family protein [Alphaproteobacteria bacterium]|nr:TolC family protein [Alphaproteobacteria bacterium]
MTFPLGRARPLYNLRLFSNLPAQIAGICFLFGAGQFLPQGAFAQSVATAPPTPHILSLSQAIERAAAFSPKLEAAASEIAAATGSELQASLYPNPQATIQMENFGGSGPLSGFKATEMTAGVSQLIELGGKRQARKDVALANRKAAEVDATTARLDLARDVSIAYADALAAQDGVNITKDTELAARQVLDDVIRRVNAARDPIFQRSKAEVAYSTSMVARKSAEQASLAALQRLGRYWGAKTVDETLVDPVAAHLDAPLPIEVYEARLRDAPDFVRYEHLREMREAELRLAQANAIPDITASGGIRQVSGTNSVAFLAGLSIPIPILNQNQGEIARAQAELRKIGQERRQAEQERSQNLVTVWTNWQTAWLESNTIKNDSLPKAERAFRLALEGYRRGAFEYLEVLDAQRTFFEQRASYIRAIATLHDARAQTERLAPPADSTNLNMGLNQ